MPASSPELPFGTRTAARGPAPTHSGKPAILKSPSIPADRRLPVRGKPMPPSAAPTGRPATSTKLPHDNTTFPTASSIAHANCPTICIRLPFGGLSPGFRALVPFLFFFFSPPCSVLSWNSSDVIILVLSCLTLSFVLSCPFLFRLGFSLAPDCSRLPSLVLPPTFCCSSSRYTRVEISVGRCSRGFCQIRWPFLIF